MAEALLQLISLCEWQFTVDATKSMIMRCLKATVSHVKLITLLLSILNKHVKNIFHVLPPDLPSDTLSAVYFPHKR